MIASKISDRIYKKPWGWEFELQSEQGYALWYLNIEENCQTSMHCHVRKTTGYVVLKGVVEVKFLSSTRLLSTGDTINLRPGVFHQTRAIDGSAAVLEIEAPNNKDDLLRLSDPAGRTDSLIQHDDFLDDARLKIFAGTCKDILAASTDSLKLNNVILTIQTTDIRSTLFSGQWSFVGLLRGHCPVTDNINHSENMSPFMPGNIASVRTLERMMPVIDFTSKCKILVGRIA